MLKEEIPEDVIAELTDTINELYGIPLNELHNNIAWYTEEEGGDYILPPSEPFTELPLIFCLKNQDVIDTIVYFKCNKQVVRNKQVEMPKIFNTKHLPSAFGFIRLCDFGDSTLIEFRYEADAYRVVNNRLVNENIKNIDLTDYFPFKF